MRPGNLVELRSPEEILATLDDKGTLDGLPFMPEMLAYFGKRFPIKAHLDRVCDTIKPTIGIREIPAAVILNDRRCDGSGHAGCQAQCRIYWKEAWLRPASEDAPPAAGEGAAFEELSRLAAANSTADPDGDQPVLRCQATEFQRASSHVKWWDFRSFLMQVPRGNVGVVRYVRVMTRVVFSEIGQHLGLIHRHPFMPQNPPDHVFTTPKAQGLEVGQLVRVRSKEEIAKTLDQTGKHKGLWFDREMLRYCGRTARVKTKVERFIDERTGRLIVLNSDCYILEGATCTSDQSDGRWFCPRAIYAWWRECWLEPVDASSADAATL